MKLRVRKVGQGPGPNEFTISVTTSTGIPEQVVVDAGSLMDSFIEVGPTLGKKRGACLVELPRESVRGSWRLWVREDDLHCEAGA